MSTTPAPLTPAELDALRIAAIREQTEAIKAQTEALIAARDQAQATAQQMASLPLGLSESFVLELLRLVIQKPAA